MRSITHVHPKSLETNREQDGVHESLAQPARGPGLAVFEYSHRQARGRRIAVETQALERLASWAPEGRLVVQYSQGYEGPWFPATNLKDALPTVVLRYDQRRIWIEPMFRDWKNRQWGMGLDAVRLCEAARHDRLFIVLALAYVFLCACGAVAEGIGLAQLPNRHDCKPKPAFYALQALPT